MSDGKGCKCSRRNLVTALVLSRYSRGYGSDTKTAGVVPFKLLAQQLGSYLC